MALVVRHLDLSCAEHGRVAGTFINTLGTATTLKREEIRGNRELEEAKMRLDRLQAELHELGERLGYVDHPAVKR